MTNDEQLARLSRSWRNQGRGEGGAWLQHERLGYNYRLSDINCALGIGQLKRLDEILRLRQTVADTYTEMLSQVPQVIVPPPPAPGVEMSWFVYVVRLRDEFSQGDRDAVLDSLRADGIGCNNYFSPIHLQSFYRERFGFRRGQFPITEHVASRTIALPFFNSLSREQIRAVATALRRAFRALPRRSHSLQAAAAREGSHNTTRQGG